MTDDGQWPEADEEPDMDEYQRRLRQRRWGILMGWALAGLSVMLALPSAYLLVVHARFALYTLSCVWLGMRREALDQVLGIPSWLAPVLQDISLVSPGLVLATTVFMSIGALRLTPLFPDFDGDPGNPRFPFPSSYRSFFVQLGLLGTIFGFIVAFNGLGPSGGFGSVDVVLTALGTALWSTFTALVLAYGTGPLLEWIFQRTRARVHGLDGVPQLDQELASAAQAAVDFRRQIENLDETWKNRHLDVTAELLRDALFEQRRRQEGELLELRLGIEEQNRRLARLEQAADERATKIAGLTGKIEGIVAGDIRGHSSRLAVLEATLAELKGEARAAAEDVRVLKGEREQLRRGVRALLGGDE